LPCPLHVRELKSFQLQGGFAPDLLTKGSAPGPRWGLRPQTPVIGSRSTRSPCAPPKLPMPPLVPVLWRRRCIAKLFNITKFSSKAEFPFRTKGANTFPFQWESHRTGGTHGNSFNLHISSSNSHQHPSIHHCRG